MAQINPLGLYLNTDGKVNFWHTEPNRNGQLTDTVIISFNNQQEIIDLRNLKYDYLTFIESPRTIWTLPCNQDPSKIKDTITELKNNINYLAPTQTYSFEPFVFKDSLSVNNTDKSNDLKNNYFTDDIRGDGLTDSVIASVKKILIQYINQYYNSYLTTENSEKLRYKLSFPDTVIDGKSMYDYLVDLFITYDFDKKHNLYRVIGYHWDYGVEIDSLKYDQSNRIIYFSRESLGSIRQEFLFNYDAHGRVIKVINKYSSVGINANSESYINPDIYVTKFTYDKSGNLNSKSTLIKEGNWNTIYFRY